jgi:hypothetical protein
MVQEQRAAIERDTAPTPCEATERKRHLLLQLKSIWPAISALLSREVYYRQFANRRQVGSSHSDEQGPSLFFRSAKSRKLLRASLKRDVPKSLAGTVSNRCGRHARGPDSHSISTERAALPLAKRLCATGSCMDFIS